jgi:hypothetical protein
MLFFERTMCFDLTKNSFLCTLIEKKKHKAQQSERKANSIVHTYGGWLGKKNANI